MSGSREPNRRQRLEEKPGSWAEPTSQRHVPAVICVLAFPELLCEEEIEMHFITRLQNPRNLILNYPSWRIPGDETGKIRPKLPIKPICPTRFHSHTKKAQAISWCAFCFFSVWLKIKLVTLFHHKYVIWLQYWLVFTLASKSQRQSNPLVLPSTFFMSEKKMNPQTLQMGKYT